MKSLPITLLQNPVFTAPAKPETKKISDETSICTRIISVIKTIFSNLVYALSCTMIDLREKTALFAKQPNFHVLSELPKKAADLEKSVYDSFLPLTQPNSTTSLKDFLNNPKVDPTHKKHAKKPLEACSEEVAFALTEAYNTGLRPVEWKVTLAADGVATLQIFAKKDVNKKKLSSFALLAKLEYQERFVLSKNWDAKKVDLENVSKEKNAPKFVECQVRTITYNTDHFKN